MALSITTLKRKPVPVFIQAMRVPRPAPSWMMDVSIPPNCARFDILPCHCSGFNALVLVKKFKKNIKVKTNVTDNDNGYVGFFKSYLGKNAL
jgi:hypothetical protein